VRPELNSQYQKKKTNKKTPKKPNPKLPPKFGNLEIRKTEGLG
jgi:hypothetical protein